MLGVVVEGPQAGFLEPLVTAALERVLWTPREEYRFYLEFVDEDSLTRISRWQNVLLIGALDSNDRVSERVKRMLSEETAAKVGEGEYRIFRRRDIWARGQTVVVLVAPTTEELAEWLRDNADVLYTLFKEDRDERMKKQLYARLEQKEMSDSLREEHGWRLRVPSDFGIVASSSSPGYVRFRRMYPDRFMTVAWREGGPEDITLDGFVQWRNELGLLFADPCRTASNDLNSKIVRLGEYEVLEVHGLWETIGPLGGGPFVGYLMHHQGSLYLLDGLVFAPDRPKEMYIRQFEVILSTFEP